MLRLKIFRDIGFRPPENDAGLKLAFRLRPSRCCEQCDWKRSSFRKGSAKLFIYKGLTQKAEIHKFSRKSLAKIKRVIELQFNINPVHTERSVVLQKSLPYSGLTLTHMQFSAALPGIKEKLCMKQLLSIAALMAASLSIAQADVITAWTFENNAIAVSQHRSGSFDRRRHREFDWHGHLRDAERWSNHR